MNDFVFIAIGILVMSVFSGLLSVMSFNVGRDVVCKEAYESSVILLTCDESDYSFKEDLTKEDLQMIINLDD